MTSSRGFLSFLSVRETPSRVFSSSLGIEVTSSRVSSSFLDLEVTSSRVFSSFLDLEVTSRRVFSSQVTRSDPEPSFLEPSDLEVTSRQVFSSQVSKMHACAVFSRFERLPRKVLKPLKPQSALSDERAFKYRYTYTQCHVYLNMCIYRHTLSPLEIRRIAITN